MLREICASIIIAITILLVAAGQHVVSVGLGRLYCLEDGSCPYEAFDDEFARNVVNVTHPIWNITRIHAHEGPVYVPHGDFVYFTTREDEDRRANMGRIRFSVYPPHFEYIDYPLGTNPNGMTLSKHGDLIICEQGSNGNSPARISKVTSLQLKNIASTFLPHTLVDNWEGLPFNSPNDVVETNDGMIWFTDPSYGRFQQFRPEPVIGNYVYRFDPQTQELRVIADDLEVPNGIAFSPDERTLYITDTSSIKSPGSWFVHGKHHVVAFDIDPITRLPVSRRLFATISPGVPDGIKVDRAGRVYLGCADGIHVFNSKGRLLGKIRGAAVPNFAFAGPKHDVLVMMHDDHISYVKVNLHIAKNEVNC